VGHSELSVPALAAAQPAKVGQQLGGSTLGDFGHDAGGGQVSGADALPRRELRRLRGVGEDDQAGAFGCERGEGAGSRI
jgi:hypothetical protein